MKTLRDPETAAYTGSMGPGPQTDADPRDFFRVLWRGREPESLVPTGRFAAAPPAPSESREKSGVS